MSNKVWWLILQRIGDLENVQNKNNMELARGLKKDTRHMQCVRRKTKQNETKPNKTPLESSTV